MLSLSNDGCLSISFDHVECRSGTVGCTRVRARRRKEKTRVRPGASADLSEPSIGRLRFQSGGCEMSVICTDPSRLLP